MSGSVSIGDSIDPSDEGQYEAADPFVRAAAALAPAPAPTPQPAEPASRARLGGLAHLSGRATVGAALTIAVAIVGVTAVIACDWWLVTLAAAGVARSDAWLRAHTAISLGRIALSTLTLVVGGLTVAGALDPRRRNAS